MGSKLDAKTELAELQEILKGHENRIRCVHTTMTNDVFYERAISFRQDRLSQLLNEITRLKHERHHGQEIIGQEREACVSIRDRIKLVKHRAKIEELRAIKAAMEAMQSDHASVIVAAGQEILDDEERLVPRGL